MSMKLVVILYGRAKIQIFTRKWLTSGKGLYFNADI